MGVRGLTTFIDNHQELLTDYKLRDTKLIVDGNNLYHFLYYYYRVPHEYGGDYYHFSKCCESFFEALRSCGIEPYVVFDGAYAADGRKFYTSMGRAKDRIRLSGLVASGVSAKILPILAHDVFCSTLKRLKIPHVMCDFEADRQVAALANQWQCPVLTNDSDFFIFNVNAGVILLDYVNLHIHSELQLENTYSRYLKVQIFYCNDLMRMLKIKEHSLVVLFATLLGNDVIDSRNFDSFFARVKLPKSSSSRMLAKRQIQIASLIEWLQTVHSVSDAICHVLVHVPHDQRDKIKSLIHQSLACYTNLESGLHHYFESPISTDSDINMLTHGGNLLPEWFRHRIQSCDVPVALINVITNRRLLLLSQVEQLKETSSYHCSRLIRQAAYGIILSFDFPDSSMPCDVVISEYDRVLKTLQRVAVEPLRTLNNNPIPTMHCVEQLGVSDRFDILMQVLGSKCDGTEHLSLDMQLLVSLVRFWILHALPKVTRLHVVALVLCFLKLGALDKFITLDSADKSVMKVKMQAPVSGLKDVTNVSDRVEDDSRPVLDKELPSDLERLEGVKMWMEKFMETPRHNNAHVFDSGLVHSFCQFQTCLQATGFLVKLLGLSEVLVELSSAVSGTVLYNIMRDLRSRRDPDVYIANMLSKATMVLDCCNGLVQRICSNISSDFLESGSTLARKRIKKTKTQESRAKTPISEDASQSAEERSVDAELDVNCDVNNRFHLLCLSES